MKKILWLSLFLVVQAPSADSFWTDEIVVGDLLIPDGTQSFLQRVLAHSGSEAQMPLFLFVEWLASTVIGLSEWALRSPNLLWLGLSVYFFYLAGQRLKMPWLPLWLAVQPFAWFYGNEARPYAMQIAAASGLMWTFVLLKVEGWHSRRWLVFSCLSLLWLCSTSMLGVAVVPAWLLIVFLEWRREERPRLGLPQLVFLGITFIGLGLIAVYYLSTLLRGAGGVRVWPLGLGNLGLVVYEFLGFSGLGPPRYELREWGHHGFSAFSSQNVPWWICSLGLLGLIYLVGFGLLIRRSNSSQTSESLKQCLIFLAVSGATLIALCLISHFPFWGRHLAPLFPFYLLTVALWAHPYFPTSRPLRMVATLLFITLLASSLLLRFSPWQRKDDYRDVAAMSKAFAAQGKTVWICACACAGPYYAIPFENVAELKSNATTGKIWETDCLSPGQLSLIPRPDIVFFTKPDLYDRFSAVSTFLRDEKYAPTEALPAFQIWTPPTP